MTRRPNPGAGPVLPALLLAFLWGAAGPAAARAQEADPASTPEPAPEGAPEAVEAPADDRIPVAVLPLGLTSTTSERYPQLAERNVGLGVHNMLVEHLYDTGRFRFVEEKPDVVADLLDRQWVSSTGAVSAETAVEHGRLLGARYVLYGEVYDFGLRALGSAAAEIRIAVQVRLVDVETSEYVPASGAGELRREGEVLATGSEVAFARSTVGLATDEALGAAVETLMRRFRPPGGGASR